MTLKEFSTLLDFIGHKAGNDSIKLTQLSLKELSRKRSLTEYVVMEPDIGEHTVWIDESKKLEYVVADLGDMRATFTAKASKK